MKVAEIELLFRRVSVLVRESYTEQHRRQPQLAPQPDCSVVQGLEQKPGPDRHLVAVAAGLAALLARLLLVTGQLGPHLPELARQSGWAKTFGLPLDLISAEEAQRLFPPMSTDGVLGAAYLPTDGYIDPSQLTFALAEGGT